MKRTAKVLVVVFIFVTLFTGGIFTNASASDFQVANGILTKYTGSQTAVIIPNDLGITEIGTAAFQHDTQLKSVILPKGLITIGISAFRDCSSLKYITIPSTVTTIEACAFEYCSSLAGIIIPSSVTKIGYYAFASCKSLNAFILPSDVITIGTYVFRFSSNIKLFVPDNSIGKQYAIDNNLLYDLATPSTSAPIITIAKYSTSFTNHDITVYASTNKGTLNYTNHTFTSNGSFKFISINSFGIIFRKIVKIVNIDKRSPKITAKSSSGKNIKNNSTAKYAKITLSDTNLGSKFIKKNKKTIKWPSHNIIKTVGTYSIIVYDKASNKSVFSFKIVA